MCDLLKRMQSETVSHGNFHVCLSLRATTDKAGSANQKVAWTVALTRNSILSSHALPRLFLALPPFRGPFTSKWRSRLRCPCLASAVRSA